MIRAGIQNDTLLNITNLGWKEEKLSLRTTSKKRRRSCVEAAAKAGINSPLGKLSAEYIADSEKLRIILEKLIQDRKDNP